MAPGRSFHFQLLSIPVSGTPADTPITNWPQYNEDLHLVHTIEGRAVLRVGDIQYETNPRCVLAIPADTRCVWNNFTGEPWNMINIHYRVVMPDGVPLDTMYNLPIAFRPRGMTAIHQLLRRCSADWHKGDELRQLAAASQIQQLLARYWKQFGARTLYLPAAGYPLVRDICDAISRLPVRAFNAPILAARFGLSVSQMNRRFRLSGFVSPKALWQHYRVAAAREALRTSDGTLKQVADQLGFRDVYYFSRWFKQQTGITAGRYRAQAKSLSI